MGFKQGCPLSATLFGLFVDGLEQHHGPESESVDKHWS